MTRLRPLPKAKATKVRLGRPLASLAKGGLLVTPAFNRYMRSNGGELTVSPANAAKVLEMLSVPPRDRSGSFSPSARGNCLRAQALAFLGAPQGQLSIEQMNLFMDGRFRHLRWQLVGLEAGFLDEVEVSVPMPAWMAKGSVDGRNVAGRWGFELKGTSMDLAHLGTAFQHVTAALDEGRVPDIGKGRSHVKLMWKHYHQIAGYILQMRANDMDVDKFALVYENKQTQRWAEFVVEPNEWMLQLVEDELKTLGKAMRIKKLPQIREECRPTTDKTCPYAAICHNPYPHLPERWKNYLEQEVRLVAKPKVRPANRPKGQAPQAQQRRIKTRRKSAVLEARHWPF